MTAPAGNALLAAELEDARQGLVEMLLVPVTEPRHVLAQLRCRQEGRFPPMPPSQLPASWMHGTPSTQSHACACRIRMLLLWHDAAFPEPSHTIPFFWSSITTAHKACPASTDTLRIACRQAGAPAMLLLLHPLVALLACSARAQVKEPAGNAGTCFWMSVACASRSGSASRVVRQGTGLSCA